MQTALSGFLFEDDYVSQSLDLSRFFGLARTAGYEGVELRDTQVKPDSPAALKRAAVRGAQAEGLAVVCLTARHLPVSDPERDAFFQRYLELCRDLDCRLLKISLDPDWMEDAAGRARRYGVTLASNNHIGGRLETTAGTREYFAASGCSNVGLLYDAMHLELAGQDYLGFIPECFAWTRNILVHSLFPAQAGDIPAVKHGGQAWIPALPDAPGVLPDWPAIFSRFKARGYRGWITVIENGWPQDRREFVARHCSATIRRFWQEAQAKRTS